MHHCQIYVAASYLASLAFGLPTTRDVLTAFPNVRTVSNSVAGISNIKSVRCPDVRTDQEQKASTIQFTANEIRAATQQGLFSEPGSSDANPGGYAVEFSNPGNLRFDHCKGIELYQYPILPDGRVYGGGDAGPFRVIFTAEHWAQRDGTLCGIVYQLHSSNGPMHGSFQHCDHEVLGL